MVKGNENSAARRGDQRMNRVALVTGAGPGLGAAVARRFADGGFDVAIVARFAPLTSQQTIP